MNLKTQKLMIERLISSSDVFARCMNILSPEYFDPEMKPVVKFVLSYYEKYHNIPNVDFINAEFDADLVQKKLDKSDVKFTCDEIEKFCQQSALYNAIVVSAPIVVQGDRTKFGEILELVKKAIGVAIQKDLGVNMFKDTENVLRSLIDTQVYEPTGIALLDDALGGGMARKQVTLFSANSGGGKSLMLANLGANYARRGLHVLQLALELSWEMIYLRNIAILSGVSVNEWKENIVEISGTMNQYVADGARSFTVKRIAGGSTSNDIRSYLKQYEMEYGFAPDVLIVDYLDLMQPNGGVKNKSISEQDKEKSEELTEIAFDFNCITITASQQNRDGIRNANPDQAIIAGGISKINTVDNYISIFMNPEMRLKGEMFLYYLKTRSSSAVGSSSHLAFNPDNLIISDRKGTTVSVINAILARKRKQTEAKVVFPGFEGEEISLPNEMMDAIAEYHTEEDDSINRLKNEILPKTEIEETEPTKIDIANDSQLWEKDSRKKFFVKSTETDKDELLSMMGAFQTDTI